jgi:hypothetical protein
MADLIVLIPSHGYSNDDYIYVSWLDGYYYVRDKDSKSFKLATAAGSSTYIQYTSDVTSGYVRQQTAGGDVTITGLDHLEGELVYVTSGGSIVGRYEVENGSITVPSSLITYQVGLPYTMKIKTMRFAIPVPNTTQTRTKRIHELTLRHVRTQGGSIGTEYNDTEYLEDIDAEFSVKSDDSEVTAHGGFNKEGYCVVKSDTPEPMTAICLITDLEVTE